MRTFVVKDMHGIEIRVKADLLRLLGADFNLDFIVKKEEENIIVASIPSKGLMWAVDEEFLVCDKDSCCDDEKVKAISD